MIQKTADNTVYDTLSETWWDEHSVLNLLRTTVNPWRVPYFAKVLEKQKKPNEAITLLDVGCGGGLLSEEFHALNCKVTGVDPSKESLKTASAHAQETGKNIEYHHCFGDDMPFEDNSFDIVSCCDVLEHIPDYDKTIKEIARVLKPGGVFLFDTINRTAYSYLVHIFIAQDFPPTRFMPKDLHVWNMFITPDELTTSLNKNGFNNIEMKGSSPKGSPLGALAAIRAFNKGKMTANEVGERSAMRVSRNIKGSYLGHAFKS